MGTSAPNTALEVIGIIRGNNTANANSLELQDGLGNFVFRGVRASAWADSVSTQFFQVGDVGGNMIFSSRNGSIANRAGIRSNSFQVTNNVGATAPTGLFEVSNGSALFNVLSSGRVGI